MPLTENAPHSEITYQIIGAGMAVHGKIGPGHKEAVYQAMLTDEMLARGLAVEAERRVEVVVENKVYDNLWNRLWFRIDGDKIYNRKNELKFRVVGHHVVDAEGNLKYYIKGKSLAECK